MAKDYYRILQVHEQAEHEVIEAAYKRLARKYHPDKDSSPGATAKMQELNEAYQVLRDASKRAGYDKARGPSDSSQGREHGRTYEQKSRKQQRQTEEQAERERVENRRREQEARKEQEKVREEKHKRDLELQKEKEKARIEDLQKKHRQFLILAVSVGSIGLFVIGVITFPAFRPVDPESPRNSASSVVDGSTTPANSPLSNSNPSSLTRPTRRTITLPARTMWMDTGVTMGKGDSFTINASGEWSNSGNETFVGANGYSNSWPGIILESGHIAQLIGKIGNRVFPIGERYSGSSPASGRLYLSINDVPGKFNDNFGSLDVSIDAR